MAAGDWFCPSCAANNFARRIDCFRCGTAKPDDGAYRQSRPAGGFREGGSREGGFREPPAMRPGQWTGFGQEPWQHVPNMLLTTLAGQGTAWLYMFVLTTALQVWLWTLLLSYH